MNANAIIRAAMTKEFCGKRFKTLPKSIHQGLGNWPSMVICHASVSTDTDNNLIVLLENEDFSAWVEFYAYVDYELAPA